MTIDGVRPTSITVVLGDRRVPPAELTEDDGWWFQQDRVTLAVPHELAPGTHDVAVEFGLRIPYLQVGPDGPLTLPFRAEQPLVLDAPHARPRRSSTARPEADAAAATRRSGAARGLGAQRERLQLDARDDRGRPGCRRHRGRDRRGRPGVGDRSGAGTAVALLPGAERGGCRDLRRPPGRRRWARQHPGREHRRLVAAGHAPHGRRAVRLPPAPDRDRAPARRARPAPADRTGGPTPARARAADPARDRPDAVRRDPGFADARLAPGRRGDRPDRGASTTRTCACSWTSRCSCPPSRRAISSVSRRAACRRSSSTCCGISGATPPTVGAIVGLLRSGGVPASVHTLYMDMLVRFGRSDATVIAEVLPWIGAFHLKFWDLDDSDDRVSGPIRDLARAAARHRLHRHVLQRVGRARVARRRPHRR